MSPKRISCVSLLKPGPILSQLGAATENTGQVLSGASPRPPPREVLCRHTSRAEFPPLWRIRKREKMNQDVQQTQLLEEFPKAQGSDLIHSLTLF